MYKSNQENERYCLLCNQRLDEFDFGLFLEDKILCPSCEKQMKGQRRVFEKEGKQWIVYHEYNEFIERLLFRYKEQRDIALKPLFLMPYKKELQSLSKRYSIVILCSSQEKRCFRGFEPLIEWFKEIDINVYSPFYKTMNWKQSSLSFEKRKGIHSVIQKKELYKLPKKKFILFDDVVTSGSTIKRAMELVDAEKIIAFSAHPKWIEAMHMYEKSCEKM